MQTIARRIEKKNYTSFNQERWNIQHAYCTLLITKGLFWYTQFNSRMLTITIRICLFLTCTSLKEVVRFSANLVIEPVRMHRKFLFFPCSFLRVLFAQEDSRDTVGQNQVVLRYRITLISHKLGSE